MKRFLSIMLTVMLVLSSFVMVSAADYLDHADFDVREVPADGSGRWFTFVTHKDGVISAGETVKPGHRISVDVYLTEGVTSVSIQANNSILVYTNNFTVDLTKKNQWQTLTFDVPSGQEITELRFSSNGGKVYYNNVRVDKLLGKSLVYSEDFEHGSLDAAVSGYKLKYSTLNEDKLSFTVAENIGTNATKAGNLYKDKMESLVAIETNPVNESISDNHDKDITTYDPESYSIAMESAKDATHIVAEFDLYNQGDRHASGKKVNEFVFAIGEAGDYTVYEDGLPVVGLMETAIGFNTRHQYLNGTTYSSVSGAPRKMWNKVVYEAKRYQEEDNSWTVDYKITYGGKTYSNTVTNAKASNFGKMYFGVYDRFGGRFYLDNIRVYEITDVEDAYVTRYTENFENGTIGGSVSGYTRGEYGDSSNVVHSSFTIDSAYDAETNPNGKGYVEYDGKYARLYNKSAWGYGRLGSGETPYPGAVIKYKDDGVTIDPDAAQTVYMGNAEYWVKQDNNFAENSNNKMRLSFKYYLPGGSTDKNGNILDGLSFGLGMKNEVDLYRYSAAVANLTETKIAPRVSYGFGTDTDHNIADAAKRWINAVLEVVATYNEADATYTYDLTVDIDNGGYVGKATATSTVVLDKFGFGLNPNNAGIAYVDDIKFETEYTASDAAKVDIFAENIYTKNVETKYADDEFGVTAGTFGETQSLNIIKMPGDTTSVQVVTALYENDILKDAAINTVDTSAFKLFAENVANLENPVAVQAGEGYSYKVFIFNSTDGLKPLADMFIK